MTEQLNIWEGQFGKDYTLRNDVDWQVRLPAFDRMLGRLPLDSVLEVGCNRGHNLVVMSELFGDGIDIVGVEPNEFALRLARKSSPVVQALRGNASDLVFKDGSFDLVFTACVLIHVPPVELPQVLSEIYRVSRRYILAIEYFAEQATEIVYRGNTDLLWKRDFLKSYQNQFPDLKLVRSGFWGPDDGFDRTHWWVMEKPRDAFK